MKKKLTGISFLIVSISMLAMLLTPHVSFGGNIFGTDGIRARIGQSPFTQKELIHMGNILGQWIIEKYGHHAKVLLGHDTRQSCAWVKACLTSGLLKYPITVIDAEILPTPAIVQLTLRNNSINCGIIISASHNPFYDNGIKLIDGIQGKISEQDEIHISSLFYDFAQSDLYKQFGTYVHMADGNEKYAQHIYSFFNSSFLTNKTIVLDCAHGATYQVAPTIFKHFGAQVICINNNPDGININKKCGATDVQNLKDTVLAEQADIGFAFDGDGDRVIVVNRSGIVKDGDDILALLIDHPQYQNTSAIVGTIMSNKGFENWLATKNYSLLRTPVGDKYIAREMEVTPNLIIGGEQSGHIILPDYLPTGDGIFTALRIMEAIILTNNPDLHTFNHMPQFLVNVTVQEKNDLTQEPCASIIRTKADIIPFGRILVRYSGTEAKLRVMVEDNNEQLAYTISQELAHELQRALGT